MLYVYDTMKIQEVKPEGRRAIGFFIKGGALLSTNFCRGRNFLPCGE